MTTKKRCPKCRKYKTLVDVSTPPVKINPFVRREVQGLMCTSCNWGDRTYVYIEEEG